MKLKKFEVKNGGKFTPDGTGAVVIDFSKSNMVNLAADQEAGKSTILDLLLLACGQIGGDKVIEALKNNDTGKIDIDLSFTGNDRTDYEVNVTKSRIQVKRDGEIKGSPKELLKKMLGVVGVSPMEIKDKGIEEIVKWLATYSTRGVDEFITGMDKLKDGIKKSRKTRADANKSLKAIREYLSDEGYLDEKYQVVEKKWVESEKLYKDKPNIQQLSDDLKKAGDKSDKYIQNEAKVKGQQERKEQIEKQISELQKELNIVEDNIKVGNDWLDKNKAAKKDYDDVKKKYDTAAQDIVNYNKWNEVKSKKEELDGYEDISQRADAKEKELLAEQQQLQWEVIPDIRGVEIVLEDSHEDEGEQVKAGFYYKGLNSRQLSASEWFGLVLQIWKKNKVQVVVIDDISTLGSKFMEILEKLVKDGCYVLMAEMKRGEQELQIEYK